MKTIKDRMEERKYIQISRLYKRINTADTRGDWVTIGVVVAKSEPKMSAKVSFKQKKGGKVD